MFATIHSNQQIFTNRGANGIDGLIATSLGCLRSNVQNWSVIGDLSALYDMNSLWALQYIKSYNYNLVVINNGGGKIFTPLFNDPQFENQHSLNLKSLAELFQMNYQKVSSLDELESLSAKGHNLIEIFPNNEDTLSLTNAMRETWKKS